MRNYLRQIMRHISLTAPAATHDVGKSYEEAVRALNTLQSNASVLEKVKEERQRNRHLNLPNTLAFAERLGMKLDDLDKLSVIHVSGTKGKGSTCAFCESILRTSGYRTGFYSSPHLVEVRERIRINGKPLAKDKFSAYFWDCYDKLQATKDRDDADMPSYFRFLTLMAFHTFLQEKVDVAIIEVGIGGQYDCTNILRSPVVCGVTSLGLDHVQILGDTLDQIAWNKAGIFKHNVPAVTVDQPENSIQVIINRAKELQNPVHLAPNLQDYDWGSHQMSLGIHGDMQHLNASLALQLCKIWIKDHDKSPAERQSQYEGLSDKAPEEIEVASTFTLTTSMAEGLRNCSWPGRNQTISRDNITYYLDGAHTVRSVQQCLQWFLKAANQEKQALRGRVCRILLFNTTGERNPSALLQVLLSGGFDLAVFCPNIATSATANADQTNYTVTVDSQHSRCTLQKNTWLQLLAEQESCQPDTERDSSPPKRTRLDEDTASDSGVSSATSTPERDLRSCQTPEGDIATTGELAKTFPSIQEALQWATQGRDSNIPRTFVSPEGIPDSLSSADHIQILCTGSLHLIGGAIRMIDPHFNDS